MKTVLILSGGLDSAVLLYQLLNQGDEVVALSINYGQRHAKELEFAHGLCLLHGVLHRVVDLSSARGILAGSALTSSEVEVPEGLYSEESIHATAVSNRNMIMLSLAIGWAISLRYDAVAYGAHAGDHVVYQDCRPEFVEAMWKAAELADQHQVRLECPFIELTKADIVRRGHELGVPFERTWSCYKGLERHCGRCSTCIERRGAFQDAGFPDPTEYERVDSAES